MNELNNLKESDKGSEATGSNMNAAAIKAERLKIIELSNESVLHGYDMAAQVLTASGNMEGLNTLMEQRPIIELGLKNGVEQRIEGNIGGTEESSSI